MTPDTAILDDALFSVLLIGGQVLTIAIGIKLWKWIGRALGGDRESSITYYDSKGGW